MIQPQLSMKLPVRANPSVSVIVPAHNGATTLGRCLDALASSTFRDFEVIVADDASTDDTFTIATAAGARVIRLPECTTRPAADSPSPGTPGEGWGQGQIQKLKSKIRNYKTLTLTLSRSTGRGNKTSTRQGDRRATRGDRLIPRRPESAGPAAARNAAAEVALGPILLFLDADVCVHPDTLDAVVASFADSSVDAVFGSYDAQPAELNLLSQYKNLAHRFYHQVAGERATTFWSGCGAMRRDRFIESGGFNAALFDRPSIEDIELGVRLISAGGKILIKKSVQARHLKHWTLWGIIRSDVFDRAIPWTRLILRERHLPNDLNLTTGQRLAAMLTASAAAVFLAGCWYRPWLAAAPIAVLAAIVLADRLTARQPPPRALRFCAAAAILVALAAVGWYARWWAVAISIPLAGVVCLNASFYRYFLRHRGWLFTAAVLPMQILYYLYSGMALVAGTLQHWRDTRRGRRTSRILDQRRPDAPAAS